LLPFVPVVETRGPEKALPVDDLRAVSLLVRSMLAEGDCATAYSGDQNRQTKERPSIGENP
jgi:hypothetical protein